jgi:Pyruvate/2-oxoacid:ferredoxin oxidoreductase delta subunit
VSKKFTDFNSLFQVANNLGITVFPKSSNIAGWEKRLSDGEIEITDVNEIILGERNHDCLFAINPENGDIHKIILYIPQRTASYIKDIGYPKYHLFHCETEALRNFLKTKNNKYSISSKTDGYFIFKIIEKTNTIKSCEVSLDFCGNCMKIFTKKFKKNRNEFNLKDFLEINHSGILREPRFQFDYDSIPNLYEKNWKEIATKHKKTKNYTCEICRWQPANENQKQFIHAHHIDGMKYNNRYDNLKFYVFLATQNKMTMHI